MGETLSFKDTVEDNGCKNNLFGLEQNMDRIRLEKYRLSNRIFKLPNFNTWKSQYFIELPTRKLDWVSDRMTDFQFKRCQNMMSREKKYKKTGDIHDISVNKFPDLLSNSVYVFINSQQMSLPWSCPIFPWSMNSTGLLWVFFNSIKW